MKSAFFFLCVFVVGCSSAPKIDNREIEKDQILSTLNDSSQPSWANEAKPFYTDGSNAYSVGVVTMYGNERPEAGMRVAALESRTNFARTVTDKLTSFLQSAEENGGMESTQAKYLASSASELTTHSIKIESYWYKRYVSTQEDGRHIYFKVYALSSMPIQEIRAAMDAAISGKANEHSLSEAFKAKADAQLSKMMGLDSNQVASKSN